MANRIKGITVEIGGDTTKLSKALEGVNKNIRNIISKEDFEKIQLIITRLTDKDKCRARTVNEDDLIAAFLLALKEMVGNSTEYLQRLKDNLETALKAANPESAEALAERMAELQQELIDRTERRERYDDLTEEILRLRELQAQTAMDDTAKKEHKKTNCPLPGKIDTKKHTKVE